MKTTDILRQADKLGITLSLTKDKIRYQPKSAAHEEFIETLRQNKLAIMRYLRNHEDLETRVKREGYVTAMPTP